MRCCPKCGGNLIGDGYTRVIHCEFVDVDRDVEPDAEPVYCDFEDVLSPSAWEAQHEYTQRP